MAAAAAGTLTPALKGTKDVLEGIRLYFDRCLPIYLLYRFEQLQYETFMRERPADDTRPLSQIYGPEHLLRLFVKLPELLMRTTMMPEEIEHITSLIHDLLK